MRWLAEQLTSQFALYRHAQSTVVQSCHRSSRQRQCNESVIALTLIQRHRSRKHYVRADGRNWTLDQETGWQGIRYMEQKEESRYGRDETGRMTRGRDSEKQTIR